MLNLNKLISESLSNPIDIKVKKLKKDKELRGLSFAEFILVAESNLEDLEVGYDAIENIELLHEMEYKISKLRENKFRVAEKLYANVIRRFSTLALEAYRELDDKFIEMFEYWLDFHDLNDPHEWARKVYEMSNEDGDDPDSIEYVGAGGVGISKEDVMNTLSVDDYENYIEYNYGESLIDAFRDQAPDFLNSIEVPYGEDQDEEWTFREEDEAYEYIEENDLEDQFREYIRDSLEGNLSEFIDPTMFALTEDHWINAVEELLYSEYYGIHGYNIENVYPDVEENIDRFQIAEQYAKRLEQLIPNIDSRDSNLESIVDKVYEAIGKLTSTISLAMNTMHTSGTIIIDYGDRFGLDDVDKSFLDSFNQRDVDDWNDELSKLIRK